MKKMEEAVKKLNEAAKAYYATDQEIMSNYEYDKLMDELETMERETGIVLPDSPTKRIGYVVVSNLKKVRHRQPALSLDKTKDRQELAHWLGDKEGVLSWKMDGLTLVVTYENGKLQSAVTRGDGYIGEDVTHNARYIHGLPIRIPFKDSLVIRGEVVTHYDDFFQLNDKIEDTNKQYKNPRNLTTGSLRLLDSKEAAKRRMQFYAFQWVPDENSPKDVKSCHENLNSFGIQVVDYEVVNKTNFLNKIEKFENSFINKNLKFPTDGLVLAYNDISYGLSLGTTGKFPKHSIAFKWADETQETKLIDIEWSASKTGLLNPVAVFEPIELEGTTVKRASVHNCSVVKELELGYQDTITVYKANMIIPQIAENLTRNGDYVTIPKTCPVCGEKTELCIGADGRTESLYCTNPDCAAKQIGQIERFVSRDGLNVVGLSKATILAFVSRGFINSPSDIFDLKNHKTEILEMEGFGIKSYDNLTKAIDEAKTTSFKQFFYSLGIPGAGHDVANILSRYYEEIGTYASKSTMLTYFLSESSEIFTKMNGIGPVITQNMRKWYDKNNTEYHKILDLLHIMDDTEIPTENKKDLQGLVFVITGKLHSYGNRKELKKEIEEQGGKVSGSVSKNTSYLINNDILSSTEKNLKAKELGIPIISEEDYKNLF